jgi:hypothetical protein
MKLIRRLTLSLLGLLCGVSSSAQSCYESSIVSPSPFMGNSGEVFKLADGSIWEVKYEYEYMYEYNLDVVVCPGKSRIIVGGKQLNVQLLSQGRVQPVRRPQQAPKERNDPKPDDGTKAKEKSPAAIKGEGPGLVESQIEGEFTGWEGETIFKLTNWQIWQQSSYAYTYRYSYRPKVLVFKAGGGYQMKVDGVDGRISVTRLR